MYDVHPAYADANGTYAWCDRHDLTTVVAEHTAVGYAGGTVWSLELACGCTETSETIGDIR
jgi:hypothetical protein